ncbi:MAG: NAD-dependent epimerase [Cyclobacteriaceae bacterium]|nr:NAD-dependent epimerase [Cyclobacteriaceae bacterium]
MAPESKKGKILVTGAGGFIGYHLSKSLLEEGYRVIGLDNLNDYYDVGLKNARLEIIRKHASFKFVKIDLKDKIELDSLFENEQFEIVINLAAQAGVRYSITNPYAYLDSNILGFLNILEACRTFPPKHLIYASSSSVYGANEKLPFSTRDNVDHPLALYAASKKSNELMAHAYSNLYHLPTTGLRFFSAYGPYGRPDMALFIFTKAIIEGRPIDIYNFGKMRRDFTYVDDIVGGIKKLIPFTPTGNKNWDASQPDPSTSFAPYRIFNIGNNKPVELLHFVEMIEEKLKKKAIKNYLPLQEGDVEENFADVSDLEKLTGFKSSTSVESGVSSFVDWYCDYYTIKK